MKKSNFIKLLLAIVCSLSLFVFVACGDNKPTDDSSNNSQSTSVSESVSNSSSDEGTNSTSSSSTGRTVVEAKINIGNLKTIYTIGEAFSSAGVTADVTYSDSGKGKHTDKYMTFDSSKFDNTKVGKYDVTVSYGSLDTKTATVYVFDVPQVQANTVNFEVSNAYPELGILEGNVMKINSIKVALAICDAKKYGDTVEKVIKIAEGNYVDKLTVSQKNVSFVGLGTAQNTVVSFGDCSGDVGGTDNSSSITIKGDGFSASNVTFANTFDYLAACERENQSGVKIDKQAVAMTVNADKCVFTNCIFLGQQDTLQVKDKRQYFKNCTIKGSTDFIFGNNPSVLFDTCNIVSVYSGKSAGYVTAFKGAAAQTAEYGVVFKNCNLTREDGADATKKVADGSISLGRPWRADATVAFLECAMDAHISKLPFAEGTSSGTRYTSMTGDNLLNVPSGANFAEYGNTGAGSVSSQLNNDFTMLTKAQADLYTVANIFAKTNGGKTYADDWNPVA